ncbi:hypothetical protein GCM10008968_24990 [Bacillus horti]
MNIPQIRISQTFAQLSIQQEQGTLELEQPHADVQIKNTLPVMEMSRENGQLHIDQSEAWAAYGSENPIDWTKRLTNHIKNVVVPQAIARIAQDGDSLGDIARSRTSIADIARQNSMMTRELSAVGEGSSLNISMEYIPDNLNLSLREGLADIQVTPQKPSIQHKKGHFMISQAQYPSISIDWVGQSVDRAL